MRSRENFPDWTLSGFRLTRRNRPGRRDLRFTALLLCICCVFGVTNRALAQPSADAEKQTGIAALNAEMNEAIQRVKVIVNQPVTALRRTQGMRVGTFSPGWFHEGATRPPFGHVDVRRTQQFPYDKYQYVTSDLNPGIVFIGRQLEFNSMTKYFYIDRSLPKKRLSEAEMLEINRLYGIIGRCEQQLDELERQHEDEVASGQGKGRLTLKFQRVPRSNYVRGAIGIAIVLVLYLVYRKLRQARG